MGNCYSIDNSAEDHTRKDITCDIKDPLQKYRLGMVSNRLLRWGGLNMFYWIQTYAFSFCSDSKPDPHEGFLTHR